MTLECIPALDMIGRYGAPGNLLYVDPPYLGETRNGRAYRHEMTSEAEHRELLAVRMPVRHGGLTGTLRTGAGRLGNRRSGQRIP